MLWLTLWPTPRLTLYIQERAGAPIHTAKNVFREREFAVLQFIDALNACSDDDVPADTTCIPLMLVNCNICLHKGIIFVNKVSAAPLWLALWLTPWFLYSEPLWLTLGAAGLRHRALRAGA